LTSKTVAQLARSKIPVRSAHDLVEGFEAEVTIADKGYDADPLRDSLTKTGA
jgi:transposase